MAFRILAGLLLALAMLAAPAWTPVWAQSAPQAKPWAHEASDIAPDPAVTWGRLPNGMRYALLRNTLPPGQVAMRLVIDFGSLHEAEHEKGLAHFIEHMAFNGSRNVPEGEMVKILERLGLAFGADTNASTSQTETIYMLDLPNASEALVDESLFLLRETASELLFDADAIERERGVVLAEFRRGDTFQRRRSEQQLDFLIPGAYAASRMPIGDPEILRTAQRDTFVSLYDRYYRPERATLVIVGDIDVAAVEAKIAARFSDWQGRGEAGSDPDLSYAVRARGPEASVFQHADGGDSVSAYVLTPYEDLPDTAANRREANIMSFGLSAVSRRLAVLANAEAAPFRRASLGYSDVLEAADVASASATINPGRWKEAVEALEQEWRRALSHGFTPEEIAMQIAAMRNSQQNASERENTRTTGQLAGQLLGTILDEAVFSTPSSGMARFEAWVGETTPDVVLEVFRRRMAMGPPLIFLSTTLPIEDPVALTEAWAESALLPVEAIDERERVPFAYTNFGAPGVVAEDARDVSMDARLVRFANNVRLNIKKTDFQKNVVLVSLRVGGGSLAFPEKPFGLSSLMTAYGAGGLQQHSADDLRAILTGRTVQSGFTASATAFGGSYSTTPADLELQLQVAAAFMLHPGYRPEAERRWRENVVQSWPRLDATPSSTLSSQGMRLLASGDKRFGTHPDDGVIFRSFTELRAYLEPLLADTPIEIAIVGDIDEEQAINAVARTFGALPVRSAAVLPDKSDRPVMFREQRDPISLTHHGEPTQALVNVYWPVNLDSDVDHQEIRTLSVLASVMRLKTIERLREELGASYSPSATAYVSSIYQGWGYLAAGSEVRPEDSDEIGDALDAIAAELREGKISEDEFSRAVTPSLEQLPRNAVSNNYWLSLIAQAQTRPDRVARAQLTAVEASLRAVTRDDLVAAARRWLKPEAAQRLIVLPQETPEGP